MIAEEIGLNEYLEENGIAPVETDLGEYIIQLRHEGPSHIIAPAVHLNKDQVEESFRSAHTLLPADRDLSEPTALLNEARGILRERFLAADVGITGANFLVAETGTSVIVTNEGNGDLTQILPRIHIVVASIEKIVPTLNDVSQIMRLLARSATGQDISVYTTFSTGPRRPEDPDGPDEYHVIILDNGRSEMLGSEFREALRCIRCGACMNHCPVYQAVGGHAYGWVYPGPIGAVLDPQLIGVENGRRPAERLDLLRPLRGGLPDADSAAQHDAPLAREGIRAPPVAGHRPLRHRPLGVLRQAAAALSMGDAARHAGARQPRHRQGTLCLAAARRRLDEIPRFPGAGRPDLPGAMGRAAEVGMSEREIVLGKIRKSLGVDDNDVGRRAIVIARLEGTPRGIIPARGQLPPEERVALFTTMAEKVSATVGRVAGPRRRAARRRRIPARAQSAGDAAQRRRSAARRHAVGRDPDRDLARAAATAAIRSG